MTTSVTTWDGPDAGTVSTDLHLGTVTTVDGLTVTVEATVVEDSEGREGAVLLRTPRDCALAPTEALEVARLLLAAVWAAR